MSKTVMTPLRNHQRPLRLLGWRSGEPKKVEIWKLKQTFLDVYHGYPLCQKPPRLLSGTTWVLLDSLDDALENPGIRLLPRKVEIWKLIEMYIMSKTTKIPLKNHQRPLRLLGWCSGEPRSKTASQVGRDRKIDTDLPWCISWISIM